MGYAGVRTEDGKPHWTSTCLNCGQCEKKCPQGIKVREEFKHVQRNLEGAGIKATALLHFSEDGHIRFYCGTLPVIRKAIA